MTSAQMIRLSLGCAGVTDERRDQLLELGERSPRVKALLGLLAAGDRSPADCLAEVLIAAVEDLQEVLQLVTQAYPAFVVDENGDVVADEPLRVGAVQAPGVGADPEGEG